MLHRYPLTRQPTIDLSHLVLYVVL